tara:strand:- start:476 stop:1492 length:1017 start_codon:yes stop_codon:yes gene_type:complete
MNATMSLENTNHYPVMLNQILSIISPQHGGMFIDCTLGGGGYTKAILKFPNTSVIAIDRDLITKKIANNISKEFPDRFKFFQDKFSNLEKNIYSQKNLRAVIFDLGLSSFQIADASRGFSFKSKGPINMEMGINDDSLYNAINNLKKDDLFKIIKILGEEKDARKITNEIIKYRLKKSITKSEELTGIIKRVKKNYKKFKKDPSTQTFQALRIFINKEITELVEGLFSATKILENNGILVVVSFHSIEDKIVKNFFKFYSNQEENPSRYLPKKNTNNLNLFKKLSKKVMVPEEKEIIQNVRSRSAKLRFAVRNDNAFFYSEEIKRKFENYLKTENLKI